MRGSPRRVRVVGGRAGRRACEVMTVVAIVLAAPALRAQTPTPPAAAFAALPAMEFPSLSADGKRLAFVTHDAQRTLVLVATIGTMAVTTAVDVGGGKLRSLTWASDDALVFTSGVATSLLAVPGRIESNTPWGVDLTKGAKITELLRDNPRDSRPGGGFFRINGAQFTGYRRATGEVLYPKFDTSGNRVLYAVDPKTDRQRALDHGLPYTAGWIVDEAGEPVFKVEYRDKSNEYRLLKKGDDGWQTIVEQTTEIPDLTVYGLDDDDELVVGTKPKEFSRRGLYVLSQTGEIDRALLADEHYDATGVRMDPYTNRVLGGTVSAGPPVWFDREFAKHQTLLNQAFPGEAPSIVSWSRDRSRMIVVVNGVERPPAVYLYDTVAPSVKQIANTYAALQGVRLPARRPYSYTARDGTTIPAYLTRPLNASGPTPLVVLPHGGPAAFEVGGFDWLAQFIATRGYTVLQPNFRGSAGYGEDWEKAGHGQWGTGVMQTDLSDGVAALIKEGVADAARVCIVGASYGGYAALAGATFTPELYRCAASISGVADLSGMIEFERQRRGGFSANVSYWREVMGASDENDKTAKGDKGDKGDKDFEDRLRAVSPLAHVEQVEAPILLLHGLDDSVVPIAQSREMEKALRAAGKDVELVELEGEDHWLSVAPTRLATLQALERFLAAQLGK
jgi:dipeptidyl aminopeptidase/acylaminoacyl peptidase